MVINQDKVKMYREIIRLQEEILKEIKVQKITRVQMASKMGISLKELNKLLEMDDIRLLTALKVAHALGFSFDISFKKNTQSEEVPS